MLSTVKMRRPFISSKLVSLSGNDLCFDDGGDIVETFGTWIGVFLGRFGVIAVSLSFWSNRFLACIFLALFVYRLTYLLPLDFPADFPVLPSAGFMVESGLET